MKKVLCLLCMVLTMFITTVSIADAYVSVKGYYKSNGTYVAPHVRSNPNGLKSDNYSYKGGEIYNKSYGTKGTYWDTPTYITDPNYYEGKSLYDSNQSNSSYINNVVQPIVIEKSRRDISYVVKAWVESNPNSDCAKSTFLRQKERLECQMYKTKKSSYDWNVKTTEFDGKHYVLDSNTNEIQSCPDGYKFSVFDLSTSKCVPENQYQTPVITCPIGYTCTPKI